MSATTVRNVQNICSSFIEETIESVKSGIEKEVDEYLDGYLAGVKERIKVEVMKKFNNLRVDFVQAMDRQEFQIQIKFEVL